MNCICALFLSLTFGFTALRFTDEGEKTAMMVMILYFSIGARIFIRFNGMEEFSAVLRKTRIIIFSTVIGIINSKLF